MSKVLDQIWGFLNRDLSRSSIYWIVTISGFFGLLISIWTIFQDGQFKLISGTGLIASLACFLSEFGQLRKYMGFTAALFVICIGLMIICLALMLAGLAHSAR